MNYLARYDKTSGRTQTLYEHSNNVKILCGKIMKKVGLERLGEIAGVMHDAGKCKQAFMDYMCNNGERVSHSLTGARYIYRLFYENEKDQYKKLTALWVIMAVTSHHSGLWDLLDFKLGNTLIDKMFLEKDKGYEETINNFFDNVISKEKIDNMFNEAYIEVKEIFSLHKIKMFEAGMLQKLLFSALIDSDRFDALCWELEINIDNSSITDWTNSVENMENKIHSFKRDTLINTLRSEISDKCFEFAKNDNGIYKLNVPTGSGKTLASLRFALNFCKEHKEKERIIYVIPYTTILDQTAKEVRDICGEDMVLEHHSSVVREDIDKRDEGNDKLNQYDVLTQRWNTPIVLTTMVQFMNSIYAQRPACLRRMNALCNSVIIIDEVQTVPRKAISLFNEALNFLNIFCNTTVVLCSATQPALELVKHKIKFSAKCDMIESDKRIVEAFKRTNNINLTDEEMDFKDIAIFTERLLNENNTILIILNKTEDTREVYKNIDCECRKIYLTTKICKAHRKDILEEIRAKTKKLSNKTNAKTSEKLIVVSTQLVEAGVDISFSCVIRVMAGVDNFAQAAGRCNRNGEYEGCRDAFLIKVKGEDLSKLPDIKYAKEITENVLYKYRSDDLLSDTVIRAYYEKYFRTDESKVDEFDYIIGTKSKSTIMELLSENKGLEKEYLAQGKSVPFLKQSFKTAGEAFRLIDSATYTIIVPYRKGKQYIEILNSSADLKVKYNVIKDSYQYTINIFEYEMKKLSDVHALSFIEEVGVYVLRDGFYDNECGLVFAGKMELLIN